MQYPIIDLLADVGGESVTGKNLLDPTTVTGSAITWGGVTLSTSGNVIMLSGTAIYNGGRTNLVLRTIHLASGTYYISNASTYGTQPDIMVQSVSGNTYTTISSGANASFTLLQDTDIAVGFNLYSGVVYSSKMKLQVELGSTATDYEPYFSLTFPQLSSDDISHRLKLPMLKYFPFVVKQALETVNSGNTLTYEQYEVLKHYLTPLGIGGI